MKNIKFFSIVLYYVSRFRGFAGLRRTISRVPRKRVIVKLERPHPDNALPRVASYVVLDGVDPSEITPGSPLYEKIRSEFYSDRSDLRDVVCTVAVKEY